MKLLGNVDGKTVFMADDMIGTGGTLIKGMKNLRDLGASKVICAVSLPLFNGSALDDFEAAYRQGLFYRIIGTNAIYHKELLQKEWYIQADVTGLFAQIISLVHHDRSLSSLLDNRDVVARLIKKQMDKGSGKQGNLGFLNPAASRPDSRPGRRPKKSSLTGRPRRSDRQPASARK